MFYDIKSNIKSTYNSNLDNVETFYNNILKESILYERVSGYFSKNGILQYANGIDRLAKNGGISKFIISTDISENDFDEIKLGYDLRFNDGELSNKDKARLGNLAYMISAGYVDIKFGLVDNGIFHSKWGLFKDKNGESIYFIGSNNETKNAMNNNYEDFDVDFSWDISQNVRNRILDKQIQFDNLWNDKVPNVEIKEVSNVVYDSIKKYNQNKIVNVDEVEQKVTLDVSDNGFVLIDNTDKDILNNNIVKRRVAQIVDKDKGYPYISGKISYVLIEDKMTKLAKILKKFRVSFSESIAVNSRFAEEKYSINEFKKSGLTIKSKDSRWLGDFNDFNTIVSGEISRPLKPLQMWSAFYMYTEKRAANFSVPGAGKTAMLLGVFARLNESNDRKIERILVVCPINAFTSWREEFRNVFGEKKELKDMSVHDDGMTPLGIRSAWAKKNLVLVNYESLPKYSDSLVSALKADNGTTLLVFDEVHRIKGLESKREEEAEKLVEYVKYKYVLTGTPIPNGYQDIWNFLHLLYNNEYNSFFNFSVADLKNPSDFQVNAINDKLQPFFWRTSKNDLGVPPANPDNIYKVKASPEQIKIAELIYETEKSQLAILIRLLQLSTNPQLLTHSINYDDLGFSDTDIPGEDSYDQVSSEVAKKIKNEIRKATVKKYSDINLNTVESSKFNKGIDVVRDLVNNNKHVVVWGLFVNTLDKITSALRRLGIRTELIYGNTPKEDRERILSEFKKENSPIKVLVSNPNTLGESVSLHKVVHDAVYFEYNYNLTFMLQSRDRIHRLGLNKDDQTNYHYLMTVSNNDNYNFIDEKVYDALHKKEKRMKEAIDKDILKPEFSDDVFEEMKNIIDSERP